MTDARRYAETWAENAIPDIAKLGDQALNDWIVANREKLADCVRFAPASHAAVKAALTERHKEIEREKIRQGIG